MPASVFAPGVLKTRLCVHSWMRTQSAWFAKAPTVAATQDDEPPGARAQGPAIAICATTMPTA